MKDIKAKIILNKRISKGRFNMRLNAPAISKVARPGQFVMVKCSNAHNPLLRRPLSFHKIENDSFELLYQVIGKGTQILSHTKPGEALDIIGPLGNGFDPLPARGIRLDAILVAGGIGVAPLYALAKDAISHGLHLTVLIGAKTKDHILCDEDFRKLGADVEIATEDGSKGYMGFATDLLIRHCESAEGGRSNLGHPRLLRRSAPRNDVVIYACGPRPMLKEAARIAKSWRIPCQVSFEERMACGTGVCLGCAVKTITGYKMACKDGPVFNAGDIIWQKSDQ